MDLDVPSGKVTIGGDGNKLISFTSREDIARYVSYVLTHLPAEQLQNRYFVIAGDNKVCTTYRILTTSDRRGPNTVVQRNLQGIRGENWEKGASHLRPGFRVRCANCR